MISIIVALDDKRGIGAKNRLLWRIKKDFQHFKEITMGHPIIMGRKTHESIGRALPGRTNIVVTRDQNYSTPGCHIVNSLAGAIDLAKMVESRSRRKPDRGSSVRPKADTGKIFIIGGGEIYQQALAQNLVDKLYLTKVKGDFNAEIFFPQYQHIFTKMITSRSDLEGDYRLEFLELGK